MSIEENKALVRRHFEELVNNKNLTVIDEQVAPDFVDHSSLSGQPAYGPEAPRQAMKILHTALPDAHVTIEDVIAEGDRVVVRNTWRGTHLGPLMGIPPTGKPLVLTGIVIWRIADGKIVERWANIDTLGVLQQLGVISMPGPAGDASLKSSEL